MSYRSRALGIVLVSLWAGAFGPAFGGDLPEKAKEPVKPVKAVEPAKASPFFFVNDNRLTFAYLPTGARPAVAAATAIKVLAFTHFDAWAYGTNYLDVIYSKFDNKHPAAPCPVTGNACAGATDLYVIGRSTLGLNQLFKTQAFTWGVLRNVSLAGGAEFETDNTYLASGKRVGVAGLQFAFDLPYKGYFNISPLYYKEWNHNSFVGPAFTGGRGPADANVDYNGTWAVEMNYYMDLGFLPEYMPFSISGRGKLIGPKGTGIEASVASVMPRTTELWIEPIRLTLDVSKLAWGPQYSHHVDVWVAYQYWKNQYGLDAKTDPNCVAPRGGCNMSSVYSGVSVKF